MCPNQEPQKFKGVFKSATPDDAKPVSYKEAPAKFCCQNCGQETHPEDASLVETKGRHSKSITLCRHCARVYWAEREACEITGDEWCESASWVGTKHWLLSDKEVGPSKEWLDEHAFVGAFRESKGQ